MDSTVAVQTKGWGASFQACRKSSIAEGPASGRGKAGRNLSWLRHFLHPETERQATEVDRYGSGVWFERRSIAWSQVPCAEQWLTVG